MDFSLEKIKTLKSEWDSLNSISNHRMDLCLRTVSGKEQKAWLDTTMNGQNIVAINYIYKLIEKEKSEVINFDVNLRATSKKSGEKIQSIKTVEAIINDIFNRSDYFECFSKALCGIYDCGYAVLCVMPEVDEVGETHLKVFNVKNPKTVFFDPRTTCRTKTDGTYCGMVYYDYDIKKEGYVEVTDFFYKKKEVVGVFVDSNGFVYNRRPQGKGDGLFWEKEREVSNLYHIRFRDGKLVSEVRVGIAKDLPFVYVPGPETLESLTSNGGKETYATCPFAWNLVDVQNILNFAMSSSINQAQRAARMEILVVPKTTKDNSFVGVESILFEGGVLPFSLDGPDGNSTGATVVPTIIPPQQIDQGILSMVDIASKSLFFLSGFSIAQEGGDQSSTTGAANKAKREQAGFYKKIAMESLIHGVKKIGSILMAMIPEVYTNQRTYVSGGESLPINIYGAENIEEVFKKHDINIDFSYGEEAETQNNLQSLEKLASTLSSNDKESRDMISYILADTLKGRASDTIKRFVEAGMNPETLDYIEGRMSRSDFQKLRDEKLKKMAPPIDIEKEKIDIEKKKMELAIEKAKMDSQIKIKEMEIKENKAKEELFTKQQELRIKALPKTENINVENRNKKPQDGQEIDPRGML